VKLRLDKISALAGRLSEEVVVRCTFPRGIECVPCPIIIDHKTVVRISEIVVQQVVEAVQGTSPGARRKVGGRRLWPPANLGKRVMNKRGRLLGELD
jgi:hypothetical protein